MLPSLLLESKSPSTGNYQGCLVWLINHLILQDESKVCCVIHGHLKGILILPCVLFCDCLGLAFKTRCSEKNSTGKLHRIPNSPFANFLCTFQRQFAYYTLNPRVTGSSLLFPYKDCTRRICIWITKALRRQRATSVTLPFFKEC